jgi:hypothetical protein
VVGGVSMNEGRSRLSWPYRERPHGREEVSCALAQEQAPERTLHGDHGRLRGSSLFGGAWAVVAHARRCGASHRERRAGTKGLLPTRQANGCMKMKERVERPVPREGVATDRRTPGVAGSRVSAVHRTPPRRPSASRRKPPPASPNTY